MQSQPTSATNSKNLSRVRFIAHISSSLRLPTSRVWFDCRKISSCPCLAIDRRLFESRVRRYGFRFRVRAVDDDSFSFNDWGDNGRVVEYMYSSSDGEGSDGEIILQPITDVDLPTSKEQFLLDDDSTTETTHHIATLGRTRTKRKTLNGILNNVGLMSFSTLLLLLVDHCAWRIVRLPLAPFYLMRPFLTSVISVSCFGFICGPLFHLLKIRSMGGLYFVPIGLLVAQFVLTFSSSEVSGVTAATVAFAVIGLMDDYLGIKNKNNGLCVWARVLLEVELIFNFNRYTHLLYIYSAYFAQVAVGTCFSYWLYRTDVSTPYNMKMVVPLPAPLGLVCLGKFYPILTALCFVSMTNGMNITNGIDGLAAGIAALAFIGMSIVASIFMGDTGSLALGGALAAMASCTGMFLPLFILSGIIVLEALSVIMQFHQYQVVGRALPTETEEHPKIYRMKLWATNEVRAKSKFWYFLRKLKKVKKSNGQVLAINEIFEKNPTTIKNYGIWLRYQSRTGYHNMYKEYRDTTLNGAIEQMYTEMASRHRVRSHCIQIIKTATIPAKLCKRESTKQFHDSKIKFPLVFKKVRPPTRKLKTTYKASKPNLFM
ncbi:60S ribosomal protein L18a [Striga asiatica]|uniref:60S ribosomal protein L18a n=1 Tax=Striga asiatica TaxID=4170 RepID=A0A5A7QCR2_STRAF|nr:60S ribosomal protein L18a [Striga asiatica]